MKKYDTRLNGRIIVSLAALTIATGLGFTTQANAQSNSGDATAGLHQIEDVGGPQRIDYAGKLRMLSQRIPGAACILSTAPDSESVRQSLIDDHEEFERILTALHDGDEEWGIIGAETDRRIHQRLDEIEVLWRPFHDAVDGILKGNDVDASLEFLATNNMALLESAVVLVSEVSREYSNPAEMSAAGAMLVNIAGRQRMLLQKILKEYCGVVHGIDALGTQEDLDATLALFHAVLDALLEGNSDAGVLPPPTDEIRQKLQVFSDEWHKVEAILDKDAHSSEAHFELQVELFEALSSEVKELSVITRLYGLAAKVQ
ncbi:MAG: type IV pili methyl-accepting chemotaxis transducer N-terminal domain-containing protein [Marinosulfonomonas sp.]|nr:type IV pili methyl-accepting chemotaxis transducer N-terminal domain-containing protein [Marinosulfonomonas sp.]